MISQALTHGTAGLGRAGQEKSSLLSSSLLSWPISPLPGRTGTAARVCHSHKAQAIYLHNSAHGVPKMSLETLQVMILLLCSALQLAAMAFMCLKYFGQNVYASFQHEFIELVAN